MASCGGESVRQSVTILGARVGGPTRSSKFGRSRDMMPRRRLGAKVQIRDGFPADGFIDIRQNYVPDQSAPRT
jgi:hypothetical protein